jgi:protein-tyrosine phosphatase
MKVLFVCTGNLCRSPMAEGLLRRELDQRGCTGIDVASSGTWAGTGNPATREAIGVCASSGIDLARHRSRPLDPAEVNEAALVIAMTRAHIAEIMSVVPDAGSKTMLLRSLSAIELAPFLSNASAPQRLSALLTALRPDAGEQLDVADPMGRPFEDYESCFTELREMVTILADILCSAEVHH